MICCFRNDSISRKPFAMLCYFLKNQLIIQRKSVEIPDWTTQTTLTTSKVEKWQSRKWLCNKPSFHRVTFFQIFVGACAYRVEASLRDPKNEREVKRSRGSSDSILIAAILRVDRWCTQLDRVQVSACYLLDAGLVSGISVGQRPGIGAIPLPTAFAS